MRKMSKSSGLDGFENSLNSRGHNSNSGSLHQLSEDFLKSTLQRSNAIYGSTQIIHMKII